MPASQHMFSVVPLILNNIHFAMHSSALQQKLEVVRFLGYFGALEAH